MCDSRRPTEGADSGWPTDSTDGEIARVTGQTLDSDEPIPLRDDLCEACGLPIHEDEGPHPECAR